MNIQYQFGSTMIEVMAYLVIASVILFGSVRAAQNLIGQSDLDKGSLQASQLMQATQEFYESNCGIANYIQPSISSLKSNGFLKPDFNQTFTLGGTLTPSIAWFDATKSTRIIISVSLPIGKNPSSFLNYLGADRVSGQTLYWDEPPHYLGRVFNDEIRENINFLMPGLCK